MTPLPKHSGKRVFPWADTLRVFTFITEGDHFFPCFRKRPFQESRISPVVNMCLCCGNANFCTGNLLLHSFYRPKREDTARQPDWFFLVSVRFRCRYCINKSKKWVTHLRKPSFPVGIFLCSYMKLTFEYFSQLTYMQWRLVHHISQTNIYDNKTEIHLCCMHLLNVFISFLLWVLKTNYNQY